MLPTILLLAATLMLGACALRSASLAGKGPKSKSRSARAATDGTTVVGVTRRNRDGTDRQALIAKYCSAGTSLRLEAEADDSDTPAVAVMVESRGALGRKSHQIGCLRAGTAAMLLAAMRAGSTPTATILHVTAGDGAGNRGVHIKIKLHGRPGPKGEAADRRPRMPGTGVETGLSG